MGIANVVEAEAPAKVALGNVELIAATGERLRSVAAGKDQVAVVVALEGTELWVAGDLLSLSDQHCGAVELAGNGECGGEVGATDLALTLVAAPVGVHDGQRGDGYGLGDAA